MSAVPSIAAARWIYQTLVADPAVVAAAPGGVWENPAPDHVSTPFVSFELLNATDTNGVGTSRILASARYVIRVVGADLAASQLATAAAAIDAALHGEAGTTTEGIIAGCVREQPFQMAEHVDGKTYRHLGGIYRIVVV